MKSINMIKTMTVAAMMALGAGAAQADYGQGFGWGFPQHNNPWLQHQTQASVQDVAEFEARMDRQLGRILKGMEDGRITLQESVRLLREHQEINLLERRFKADGHLGQREIRALDERLDLAARNIIGEMRDGDRRGDDRRDSDRYGRVDQDDRRYR